MSDHRGPVLATSGEFEVLDCEVCGWIHLDPIPTEAELAVMYEQSYYDLNPGWLDKDRSEQAYWDLEHSDKLADWGQLLDSETNSLLDVGCSGGLLLEFAAAAGWHVEGIEPSGEAVSEARSHGLTIHQGLYNDVDLPAESFDVVHSKLVVEHLPDPGQFLAWCARLLRPGGIVSVQIPNDFNPLQLAAQAALGKPKWWIAPPFHVNYFTYASLEKLMRSERFEPVARDATFPMEWFLLMGEDYVGDDRLGLDVHQRRMRLEPELELLGMRRPFHAYLAEREAGREAIVHARLSD